MKTNAKPCRIVAWQLRQNILPEALHKLGAVCLFSQFVPRWTGPSLPGLRRVGSFTLYSESKRAEAGITFWFFLPDECEGAALPVPLLQSASLDLLPWTNRRAEASCATHVSHALIEKPAKKPPDPIDVWSDGWFEQMEATRQKNAQLREEAKRLIQRATLAIESTKRLYEEIGWKKPPQKEPPPT